MTLRVVEHAHRSDTGRQRRVNEDSMFARPPLFAVADGMGGAQAGEVASQTAIERFGHGLPEGGEPEEARLAERVREANGEIHAMSRHSADRAGMGTTLTAAYVGERAIALAHVGDSRAYRLRDGSLERLTKDHSLVEELLRQGKLTEAEAEEHPQRSIITRALGPEPDVEVDQESVPARGGDVYLLCSDGLTSMVRESDLAPILAGARDLDAAAKALVHAANEAGGRDNITVVLFRLEDVGGGGGAAQHVEQATTAGHAAPRTEDVRDAVARAEAQEPRTQGSPSAGPVAPRAPRERVVAPDTRRRRVPAWIAGLLVAFAILALVSVAGWAATQTVYFVGVDEQGRVTLYRGVPYELPGGLELYSENFVSGVPARELTAKRREKLLDHSLRSRDDAVGLVRAIERGEVDR